MTKQKTVEVTGYWIDEPEHIFDVTVALGTWDGVEDAQDESIFYYMDNEPLTIGSIISEGFIVKQIGE